MLYRHLGNSGVQISTIGIGTNRFGNPKVTQEVVDRILDTALERGINHLDTANIYTGGRSEETIGQALKGRRERFFIATKVGMSTGEDPNERGASRTNLFNGIANSLRRLQTDFIDLYYMHRWDPNTPIEETLRALDDLVRAGKVRYIGCSEYAAYQLDHANLLAEVHGWTPFAVIQSDYSFLNRGVEQEVLPCCRDRQVGFIPFYPLAGGFLTGKYRRGQPAPAGSRGENSKYVQNFMTPANYDLVERLTAWATERGHAMNELAIAWLLAQPPVCSVIAGVTQIDQLLANAKAADWQLTQDEVLEVDAILKGG
jgi:aryl-alcohol dehydrogenase-like predicted oxidoreductase